MIYLVDSPLTQDSHSYFSIKIIEQLCDSKINLFSLPNKITVDSILTVINKLQKIVTKDDVVVCPWVLEYDERVAASFLRLCHKCTIVGAVGNDSICADNLIPAALPGVIAVGCLNKSGKIAQLSNFLLEKEAVWVPGTNFNVNGVALSGTSIAACVYAALRSIDINNLEDRISRYQSKVKEELSA